MQYKNIKGTFKSFEQLLSFLENLPRKHSTLIVGIDGCGGSGKSTFAKELAKVRSDIKIVHVDDFYFPSKERTNQSPTEKPIGGDVDWQRLKKQVLEPLYEDKICKYQKYNWISDKLDAWEEVISGGVVIIEGVYSIRKELSGFYDYKIYVDCSREIRLKRGIERDGEAARDMWEKNWMLAEDKYVKEHMPYEFADLVIDASGDNG